MKNYSKNLIKKLQEHIDNNQFSLQQLTSFDEMPKTVSVNGVKVVLTENNGKKDAVKYMEQTFNMDDHADWKKEGVGKFYSKDWKKGNSENTYEKYFTLTIRSINALVRKINADEDNLNDDVFEYCTDFIINGESYSIIKMFSLDRSETYSMPSILDENNFSVKLLTTTTAFDNDDDTENSEESLDAAENVMDDTEELF